MAYYAYKRVRDLLPAEYTSAPDYEGGAGYDGDQWHAAADYIEQLLRDSNNLERRVRWLEKKSELSDLLVAATKAVCDITELADLWMHGGQSEINEAREILDLIKRHAEASIAKDESSQRRRTSNEH